MVKFIFGPTLGTAYGLSIPITVLLNTLGMVTPAYLVSFFGNKIRRFYKRWWLRKKKKVFTKRNRRFVRVWNKYGLRGVAFLVPFILMPIPGALVANTFSKDTTLYIKWLWIFGGIISLITSCILKFGKDILFRYME